MERDRYKKTLSQNLKAIRRSKGLTTVDLAKILGVSQAKISYIEHCKGILSARDVAILSRRLDVPVTEFFRGLSEPEDASGLKELVGHLVRFGAVLLAKPAGITLRALPFEDVFARSLGFIEDERLHRGFCAALITQAAAREISIDRVFAIIGDNPFLTSKAAEQAERCLKVIERLNLKKQRISARAKQQIQKLLSVANGLLEPSKRDGIRTPCSEEISNIADFVEDCLNAKR
jgi:transcriptional regulator with XRE-family HTH domain